MTRSALALLDISWHAALKCGREFYTHSITLIFVKAHKVSIEENLFGPFSLNHDQMLFSVTSIQAAGPDIIILSIVLSW